MFPFPVRIRLDSRRWAVTDGWDMAGSDRGWALRRMWLASVAAGCLTIGVVPALADGGAGGSPGGGAGGLDSLSGTGGAGGTGSGTGAGGGGGAGVTGGAGGSGAVGGAGGSGGASAGANGANGSFGTGAGAGGGGGGAHGYVGITAPTGAVAGGNGGYGGSDGGSNGGGGGAGGYGAVISGTGLVLTQSITGGTGGNGGYGSWSGTGYGGDGGTGGVGLALTGTGGVSVSIRTQITGGNGGQAGTGSPGGSAGGVNGTNGAGGVGITGADLNLVLTSTAVVSGGLGGDGVTQAAAIAFTGGVNVLELQPGATLVGAVTGADADDVLTLGGPSGTASLDLGQLEAGGQLAGFGLLLKTGASVWTLTGSTSAAPDVSVNGGTLVLSRSVDLAGNMVVASGATLQMSGQNTLDGPLLLEGTLAAQGSNVVAGSLTLAGVSTISVATGSNLAVSGALGGVGSLTKTGEGSLALADTGGYGGALTVSAGTLMLGARQSLSGAVTIGSGGTFQLGGGNTLSGAVTLSGTLEAAAGASTLAAGLVLSGTGLVTVASGASLDLAATVTGSGRLLKAGAGTLTLSGSSAHTGGTDITAGRLALASGGTLIGAVGIAPGAVLALGGGSTLAGTLTLGGTLVSEGSNRLTGALVLGTGATIATGSGGTLQVDAAVSGTGGLLKTGAGTLALTQASSYAGDTVIAQGTLALSGAATLAASLLTVGAGATLDLSGMTADLTLAGLSGTGTVTLGPQTLILARGTGGFGGTLTGTGGLTIDGADQRLEGTFTYSGATRVSNGTLTLNGTLTQSGIIVGSGGVLTGNAAMASLTVQAGGVVSPGNSPGTMTVAQDVTFTAGATYLAGITASGEHDLITAGGVASLGGATLRVVTDPGIYLPGTRYVLLTATGGVTGTFGTLETNYTSHFLDLVPTIGADSVTVEVVRNGNGLLPVSPTGNEAAVVQALESLGSGSLLTAIILQLSAGEARAAFNALSGEVYASAATVTQQQSVYVRDAVGARLRQSLPASGAQALSYGPAATAALAPGLTPILWAQGYGGWGSASANGNAAGVSNSIGGFLMGADVALSPQARAGLFAGFGQSQFEAEARASSGSMDTYTLGAYAGAQFGPWALRAGASYGWNDVSVTRAIAVPNLNAVVDAGYSSGTAQVFGEVGYDFALGSVSVEPFAGLAYVNAGGASFSETGSIAALSVSTAAMDTLYSTLGVRAATSFGFMGRSLTPSLMLGWQHAFGDTAPTSTIGFAGGAMAGTVTGVPIATDALLVEAGLSGALSDVARLGMTYSGQLASGASQNALTAQFSLRF